MKKRSHLRSAVLLGAAAVFALAGLDGEGPGRRL